ncbi:sigma factor [Simiaoa sunii]|jgi:DNA-directed RNA polymerase specialized sigma24 family protein|uniref:RNA polymerase sigma-70 region 2 domain-containing protein n=1 Tax=Simiaoa sunii TaxID=2763672 RepID=A0A7G9FUD0_9FIRM|nr:sigma factor [Simiaoa sunii]QNM02162.1 hypothetical protein H9Q77_13955 [Simiaoa sunii]
MESSYFDKIPETELIEKFNSPTTSREESSAILAYLLEKYQAFLADQCRRYFSNSTFINFEDILQECALTFIDVLHSYDPKRGRLTTALVPYLQHTFSDYVAKEHGSSQYDNLINSHIQKVLSEEDLTGNEDPDHLNALYNKKYPKNPLSSKSFKKHLEYYQLQNPVYLDQYSPELLLYAVQSDCDSVWHSIDDQATYTIIKNYIEKKEGNDRLLLLFLFNYISYIEIDGYTYFRNENPHPVKPLRNACLALFPELSRYLYDNACIPDMQDKTLLRFLRHFTALKF